MCHPQWTRYSDEARVNPNRCVKHFFATSGPENTRKFGLVVSLETTCGARPGAPRRRATRTSLSPKANARMLDPDCGHVAAMGSASACCQSSRSACLLAVINARQGLAKIPMAKGTRGQLAASSGTVRCLSRVELAVCRHLGREALVSNSKIDKKVHGAGIVGDFARVLGVVGFCL
jgi:hypothetical protein